MKMGGAAQFSLPASENKKGAVAKFTEFQRVLPAPLLLVNLRENCF